MLILSMEDGRECLFSDEIAITVMASLNVNFAAKKSYNVTVTYTNIIMTFKKK